MSVTETIQDIRERLKAVKEAVASIELRESQLEAGDADGGHCRLARRAGAAASLHRAGSDLRL